MFKVLNNNVHVAAIKTTGNVFAYEAVEEMNIKTKNWKDLLSDSPFVRNDIIVLQDPKDYSKFNLAKFHHIKNSIKVDNEGKNILFRYISIQINELIPQNVYLICCTYNYLNF